MPNDLNSQINQPFPQVAGSNQPQEQVTTTQPPQFSKGDKIFAVSAVIISLFGILYYTAFFYFLSSPSTSFSAKTVFNSISQSSHGSLLTFIPIPFIDTLFLFVTLASFPLLLIFSVLSLILRKRVLLVATKRIVKLFSIFAVWKLIALPVLLAGGLSAGSAFVYGGFVFGFLAAFCILKIASKTDENLGFLSVKARLFYVLAGIFLILMFIAAAVLVYGGTIEAKRRQEDTVQEKTRLQNRKAKLKGLFKPTYLPAYLNIDSPPVERTNQKGGIEILYPSKKNPDLQYVLLITETPSDKVEESLASLLSDPPFIQEDVKQSEKIVLQDGNEAVFIELDSPDNPGYPTQYLYFDKDAMRIEIYLPITNKAELLKIAESVTDSSD